MVNWYPPTSASKTTGRAASSQSAEQLGSPLSSILTHMIRLVTRGTSVSARLSSPVPSSRTHPKYSNRVKGPAYRTEIESHRVDIDNMGEQIPEGLNAFALRIMEKGRLSPGLNVAQLASIK